MSKTPSKSGVIIVLLCLALILYYYLIFRHSLITSATPGVAKVNPSQPRGL